MRVIYTGSRNLYPYIHASLKSLLEHNKVDKVYLFIEDDEFPFDLPKNCEVRNVSNQTYFPETGVNHSSPFTYFCLLRVCLAEMLPNEDKIISLDADTIVNDSLEDMWNIDLTGKWFAMCPEELGKYRPFGKDQKYYNAGVALYNLKQLRKDKIVPTMVKYLNKVESLCMDQEAWNYFGQDKAVILPVRFNETPFNGYTDHPAVIHFCGNKNWQRDKTMYRREYLDKYLDIPQKYMIHVCNDREWYVKEFLFPSLIDSGISKDDIIIWHDKKGIGNLASFVASCEWIGENLNIHDNTWHLQDDIVISDRFFTETQKFWDGVSNGFCNELFDGERTNYLGVTSGSGMWFSFQCVCIPNRMARDFAKWFHEECVPKNLYPEFVSTGRCDDSLFNRYLVTHEPNVMALNIFPCIVDHIDFLIGGTVINKEQNRKGYRQAIWRDEALDRAVKELTDKLAKRKEARHGKD